MPAKDYTVIIYFVSSSERFVHSFIAFIKELLNPPLSNSATARMVVPPGEQTASLRRAGCSPVSSTIFALPKPPAPQAYMQCDGDAVRDRGVCHCLNHHIYICGAASAEQAYRV